MAADSDSFGLFECALDEVDQRPPSASARRDRRVRRGADIRNGELRGWNTADAASGGCPYPRRRGLASCMGILAGGGAGRQLRCPPYVRGREEGSLGHDVYGDTMRPGGAVGQDPGVGGTLGV